MRIIEIFPLPNGGHRNQSFDSNKVITVPNGWAVIPDDMVIPSTFPFVGVEVENNIVISMAAGIVPEPQLEANYEAIPTPAQQIAALEAELAAAKDELTTTQLALCDVYELIGG